MSPIQGLEKQRAEAAAATPLRTARAVAGLLRYLAAAALMVCMFVVTLLVGSYYVGPAPTVVRQESLRNADSGHRAEIADGRDRPTPRSLSSKDDSFAPTSPTVIEQEILESAGETETGLQLNARASFCCAAQRRFVQTLDELCKRARAA